MTATLVARKRADLLSITGAAVAGAAAGAWLGDALRPWAVLVLVIGLVVHAVGMTARHRIDRVDGPLPRTWQLLYIVCWIAVGALVVALGATSLRGGGA